METKKRHDWSLIIMGIVLILCGAVFVFAPVGTLVTLTIFAGVFFLVAGIFSIINYIRFHKTGAASGWTIFYGILDILIGLMFLIHPVALAAVIPWVIGAFVLVFGIFELVAAFQVKKTGSSVWGWVLFSGIIEILIGILFFVFPASVVIFIAAFLLMRGIELIIFGWMSPSLRWS